MPHILITSQFVRAVVKIDIILILTVAFLANWY
jgi:hypothetical protein